MGQYEVYGTVSKRADEFATKIEKGVLKKKHLCNHGRDFTKGPEQIAHDRFCKYEGSCGHKLLQIRTRPSRRIYIG